MPDFMDYMHEIQFRLGSAPDPLDGVHSAPTDSLAGFRGGEGRGGEGKEGDCLLVLLILRTALHAYVMHIS